MQLWHGTADDVLYEQNLPEETKEWTTVLGVAHVRPVTSSNSPLTGYTRVNYGGKVESILAQDVGHTVPVIEAETLKWFGI
jgi:acetylxylan esterase